MQISSRRLVIEAGVATAMVLAAVAVAAPAPHLGWGFLRPHPVWLVVMALAARYGARGLVTSVPVAWGALALLAVPWRAAPARVLTELARPSELGALAAALVVSWIASVHERRAQDLEEQRDLLAGKASSRGGRAGGASPGRAGPARAQRSSRSGAHLPARRGATDRRRRRQHRLRGGAGAGRGAAGGARGGGPDATPTGGGSSDRAHPRGHHGRLVRARAGRERRDRGSKPCAAASRSARSICRARGQVTAIWRRPSSSATTPSACSRCAA